MGQQWTRVAVLIGALALVLAGIGVGAVIGHDEDDDEQAAAEVTTTTFFVDTTTSTMPVPATTTTSPPSTVAGRTTTTRASSTTVRPTTTTRPGAQTTVAGRPLCAAEQMDISIALGTSYAPGQPVRMETTLRNKSSSPCYYRGYTVTMTFLDPGGGTLVGSGVHADDVEDRAFAPGQRITHDATWDPKVCQAPPCTQPPGIYAATADWSFSGGRYTARQEFIVRAS